MGSDVEQSDTHPDEVLGEDSAAATEALNEASILLDGHHVLAPGTPEYSRLYVERPRVESYLFREAERAERVPRPFHWCFTGHTGSGKSTELNRIIADPVLTSKYLPVVVDLESDFNIHTIEYSDLILAMGRAAAAKADDVECPISEKLRGAIEKWGAEIFTEEEITTRTEGTAGVKVSIPFLALGEEVRSGGGKTEKIRRNISTNVLGFTRLINDLAETLYQHTGRHLLVVLDGLDHADAKRSFQILNDHFETIKLPQISKILVIPLALLNTPFMATIGLKYSTVPNVKVFAAPDSSELDAMGLQFYEQVISRYVSLDLFSREARQSLFCLSAGILRDMIRNTGDACAYALEAGAPRVEEEHAEKVWFGLMRFYRAQLLEDDYKVLRKVEKTPYIEGVDGVPKLLHSKAVVFYPNAEGWFGVHPAVRRILEVSQNGPGG